MSTTTPEPTATAATRDDDLLAGSREITEFAPGVFGQLQAGWLVTIETSDGLVQIDTGDEAAQSISAIRERTDAPFAAIIYSHGHQRYNKSAREWVLDAVKRDGRVPRVIAHENVARRQRRYEATNGTQNRILERQFRYPPGSLKDARFEFLRPTETFRDQLDLRIGGRDLQVIWAPSETDDAVAVWMPKERILYGGPACIPGLPNSGSPQRPVRDPNRWADTLDRLTAYPAELLIREFGKPIEGAAKIAEYLTSTSEALRWCVRTVEQLMNEGRTIGEIVNMVEFPPEIFDKPWLVEGYTAREHILRDVYRINFGWWEDLNPTSLHPAHPADIARETATAITDKAAVIDRVKALQAAGDIKLALHIVDLLALADGDDPFVIEARSLKAELCMVASKQTTAYVSQSLYRNGAAELQRKNEASGSPS